MKFAERDYARKEGAHFINPLQRNVSHDLTLVKTLMHRYSHKNIIEKYNKSLHDVLSKLHIVIQNTNNGTVGLYEMRSEKRNEEKYKKMPRDVIINVVEMHQALVNLLMSREMQSKMNNRLSLLKFATSSLSMPQVQIFGVFNIHEDLNIKLTFDMKKYKDGSEKVKVYTRRIHYDDNDAVVDKYYKNEYLTDEQWLKDG